MAKDLRAFLKIKRVEEEHRPVNERIKDHQPVFILRDEDRSKEQSSRCMDCGTPFCHWGCPVGNYIPEWNEAAAAGHWEKAYDLLAAANNLPEVTGRVCPAPCEFACVLAINDDAVTIRLNELAIIEKAFKEGLVKPRPPKTRTGKKVAVIGSGPAGLSCAAELNRAGHQVVVLERDDRPGGIMRYGIPDFKLEKEALDRRIEIWKKEGIEFRTGANVDKLPDGFDATVLAGGSRRPRDLKIEGRELKGIHFAMEYLAKRSVSAEGKKVVVIGGGDTGSDCVGWANRQGALSVVQIELLPQPGLCRPELNPWPTYPLILKTTTSHEEGVKRLWSVKTEGFLGQAGMIKGLRCVRSDTGEKIEIEADLALLALGFLGPETELLNRIGVELDARGNVKTDGNYQTSIKNVFSAGDMRRGQSLIVWAIYEGRQAASAINSCI
ncbi:glutamate synthase subunit beta [Candidatus Saganbacteria bacterium]|nr:glutamate synthase subunit beta [Candidatus Saganbacteria bacterium]